MDKRYVIVPLVEIEDLRKACDGANLSFNRLSFDQFEIADKDGNNLLIDSSFDNDNFEVAWGAGSWNASVTKTIRSSLTELLHCVFLECSPTNVEHKILLEHYSGQLHDRYEVATEALSDITGRLMETINLMTSYIDDAKKSERLDGRALENLEFAMLNTATMRDLYKTWTQHYATLIEQIS